MASFTGEANASSYSNVTLYVGGTISSCTRSGNTITLTYNIYGYNPTSGYYSENSICLWYNGKKHTAFQGSSGTHTTKGTKYYGGEETQSFTIGNNDTSFQITIGVNQNYYNPSSQAGSVKLTVTDLPVPTAPSGVWASHSNVTRTSALLSGGYSSIGDYAEYAGYAWDWGTSTSYGQGGNELSGLTPNTTYYYKYTVQNTAGYSASATGSFKTLGNAPSITGVVHSQTRTECTFSYIVTYDTNDSKSSEKIDYGTTTSYGSSTTSNSISGLSANTVYYYKITATSTQGRTSTYTNSFRTTGNAPSITAKSTTQTRTGCTFSISASYDTNASFSSREIQYGTSTNYGSSTTGTSISNLTPNTTYYYRVRVTDNFSRTSSWSTGSFKTSGNAPTINSVSVSKSRTSITVSPSVSYDTNASFSSQTIEYGTSTSYGSSTTGNTISNLSPNTNYYFRVKVTDNQSRTSSWYTGNDTTTGNNPTISSGTVTNIKSKSATISITSSFDTNARISSMTIKLYLNNTLTNTLTSTTNSKATGDILKPGKNYTAKITVTDNWSRTSSEYTLTFKTKGGFKFNGKMSDSARLNGKEVIGMKFNGIEII